MYNAVPMSEAGEGVSEVALGSLARLVNHLQASRPY